MPFRLALSSQSERLLYPCVAAPTTRPFDAVLRQR